MKTFEIEVTGTTDLLQNRFVDSSGATRKVLVEENPDVKEIAKRLANIDSKGQHYFNAMAILGALKVVGSNLKLKGSRKNVKWLINGAVQMVDPEIYIVDSVTGKPFKDFLVDSRPVTIPATKGKIMRHRPRYHGWKARFLITIEETLLDPQTIHTMLQQAGMQAGIGEFRPERGGPFGKFNVSLWKEV